MILVDLGDYSGAINSFSRAININPKEPEYLIERGFAKYYNDENGCEDWSKAGELGEYDAYNYIKEYCK